MNTNSQQSKTSRKQESDNNKGKTGGQSGKTRPRRFTYEAIIEACKKTGGSVGGTAKLLGCNRKTIYRAKRDCPEVMQAFEDAAEDFIDFAESKLRKKVREENLAAILFVLRTKGAQRGWRVVKNPVATAEGIITAVSQLTPEELAILTEIAEDMRARQNSDYMKSWVRDANSFFTSESLNSDEDNMSEP